MDRPFDPVHVFHLGGIAVDVRHDVVILKRHRCRAGTCLDLRPHFAVSGQQAQRGSFASLDQRDQDVHDRRQHVSLGLVPLLVGEVDCACGHVPIDEAGRHLGEKVVRQVFPLVPCQPRAVIAEVVAQRRVVTDLCVVNLHVRPVRSKSGPL